VLASKLPKEKKGKKKKEKKGNPLKNSRVPTCLFRGAERGGREKGGGGEKRLGSEFFQNGGVPQSSPSQKPPRGEGSSSVTAIKGREGRGGGGGEKEKENFREKRGAEGLLKASNISYTILREKKGKGKGEKVLLIGKNRGGGPAVSSFFSPGLGKKVEGKKGKKGKKEKRGKNNGNSLSWPYLNIHSR